MSRGVSNLTRLGVNRDVTAYELARKLDSLPFGFVGTTRSRLTNFTPSLDGQWADMAFDVPLLDSDELWTSSTTVKIPDGCQGVWQVSIGGRVNTGAGEMRVRRGIETICSLNLGVAYATAVGPAVLLNVGDTLTVQARVTTVATMSVVGQEQQFPFVSMHRLGLPT